LVLAFNSPRAIRHMGLKVILRFRCYIDTPSELIGNQILKGMCCNAILIVFDRFISVSIAAIICLRATLITYVLLEVCILRRFVACDGCFSLTRIDKAHNTKLDLLKERASHLSICLCITENLGSIPAGRLISLNSASVTCLSMMSSRSPNPPERPEDTNDWPSQEF